MWMIMEAEHPQGVPGEEGDKCFGDAGAYEHCTFINVSRKSAWLPEYGEEDQYALG